MHYIRLDSNRHQQQRKTAADSRKTAAQTDSSRTAAIDRQTRTSSGKQTSKDRLQPGKSSGQRRMFDTAMHQQRRSMTAAARQHDGSDSAAQQRRSSSSATACALYAIKQTRRSGARPSFQSKQIDSSASARVLFSLHNLSRMRFVLIARRQTRRN